MNTEMTKLCLQANTDPIKLFQSIIVVYATIWGAVTD